MDCDLYYRMARVYLRRTVSGLAVHDGDLLDG
jgi:hypothetical protein